MRNRDLTNQHILISGASVAGPALAYWLGRYGFCPTVVERAPQLRGGGYAVDFRGPPHLSVLAQMGLLEQIQSAQTHLSTTSYVDESGRAVAEMPGRIFSGDVEILRGDLGRILYQATQDSTEYLFGDTITALTAGDDGVHVSFERAAPRTFDLVIGADGLHSKVRQLAFAGQPDPVRDLGLYVSIFNVKGSFGLDRSGLLYSVPGRTAAVFSARHARAGGGAVLLHRPGARFADPLRLPRHRPAEADPGPGVRRRGVAGAGPGAAAQRRRFLLRLGGPGRAEPLVGRPGRADRRRRLRGRPGGNGTGTAVIAAYVLAGELAAAHGDYRAAFPRYEQRLRRYVARGQKQARGGSAFLAPATAKRIRQRDRTFRMLSRLPLALIRYMSTRTAAAITLPGYQGT